MPNSKLNSSDDYKIESARIINLGLYWNIVLAVSKTLAGIFGNSRALLADGINSCSDVVYYLVIKIFMAVAHKPADEKHPYGHRQIESIAALVVGAFVVTTAASLFWDSAKDAFNLFFGEKEDILPSKYTLIIALCTILSKIYLYFSAKYIGKKYLNIAITALAYDHRNDILSASAAGLGILFSYSAPWFDPIAGALVSLLILKTGIKIIRESSDELMDAVPGTMLNQSIIDRALKIPGVLSVEELRAHRFGPFLVANITIGVSGSISVKEGNDIASKVEEDLVNSIDNLQKVYIHYHPAEF